MAGYRDTLNLPKTDFPMKADLPKREPERLRTWSERGLYERLRRERAGRPVWLLHDGPPYSNNHLHMGTAANKIWKDATVRVASLLGFDAPFVPGWDNHGMPIEVEVGKEFRARGEQPDRVTLRRRCRAYAEEWVAIQREEFERCGVWGEWNHPYLTMDSGFEAAIVEAFAELAAKGFIQRGLRSIHWCPTDRTALAEAEIEYQDDPSPSIFVAFPLREDSKGVLEAHPRVSAVAWTTTPWTLPANRGLMVAPDADYVVVELGGRTVLVAEGRAAALAAAVGWPEERHDPGKEPVKLEVRARFKGRDLLDVVFTSPWGNPSPVVDGTPFVSLDDGTGFVHTAPGHGKEDFVIGQRNGLEVFSPVDEAGRFTAGAEPFVGRSVLEVNDDIIAWLRDRGVLVAASKFTHAYPHCWRCRNPVIFRATKQWFMIVDHDGHRDRCLDLIERAVRWDPPSSQNRIRESVRGRPDWCLSRQRAWGVGIPALYCETCQDPFLDDGVMRKAAELTRAQGSDTWYELPVERFVTPGLRCPSCKAAGPFRKETDILDVWFDSGCTHRATQATHPEFRAAWRRAWDEGGRVVYFEGPDQHRGWFNSSLMVSAGLERRAPYTDVLTHGWVLDGQGRAMHKSVGNVISPLDVIAKSGADIVRWWALATDWRNDVRIGDEILSRVSDAYRKVRNTFRFLLGNLHDFTPADVLPPDRWCEVDRAFASFLGSRLARLRADWEQLAFHRAMDGLLDLCTVDLSALYLDVAKDRLYTSAPADRERRSTQTVLWRALRELVLAASPALAFTSDEVWQAHPALMAEAESVHLAEWVAAPAAEGAESEWLLLREVRDAVNAVLEPMRAAKTLAGTAEAEITLHVPPSMAARLERYARELPGFLIVARVRVLAEAGDAIRVEAVKTSLPKCERCWTYREDVATGGLCARCGDVLSRTGRTAAAC
jgi:isoleucyl-tRNA synthetase